MNYSSLVDRVKGDAADVWDSHHRAQADKNRGEDVIVLSVGDPDFDTPDGITEAAVAALRSGDTHYTSIAGIEEFRETIAKRYRPEFGEGTCADNVIVTSGAQNALFIASMCITEKDDEVIVLQPMYVTYEATVRASGATLVPVVLDEPSGFRLNVEHLKAAITSKTKAIYFATPSNPTGISLNQDELQTISDLAIEHDLWVVSDEVYSDLVFDFEFFHIASFPGMSERTITLGSLSKSYAMTGWRIGWALGPKQFIDNAAKLALCMLYGLPGFLQQGGIYALESAQQDIIYMREAYRGRRDLLIQEFDRIPGLKSLKPDAGMFLMVDVRGTGLTGPQFVTQLYEHSKISVLDATAFGASAKGYVRVSFAVDESTLLDASKRISAFVGSLNLKAKAL
ncbi:MAG: arginine:pyruvate transaminase [Urechidicola sp.]|jgi:arginine:pyruvate transaminase